MLTGLSHSYITKVDAFYRRRVTNFPPLTTTEANRYNSGIVETLEIKGKEQRLIEISDKGITQKFVIIAFY